MLIISRLNFPMMQTRNCDVGTWKFLQPGLSTPPSCSNMQWYSIDYLLGGIHTTLSIEKASRSHA